MSIWQGKIVLMMAGGTGGHVYPALAVARAVSAQGATVHWLGNAQGFEGKKVPAAGFELHDIAVRGLRGKGAAGWLKAPFMLSRAVHRAKKVIKTLQPDIVIGMGGFASGPGGLAAKLCGVPLAVHEQNAVMGMTNTWLSKFAQLVMLADKRAAGKLPKGKDYLVTGNPVREDIAAIAAPEARYPYHYGTIKLLVLGGSQGAKAINELVPAALALLPENARLSVTHQTGETMFDSAKKAYEQAGVKAQVQPFIDDMAQAYADADWVIARSGALTVAEIATAGLPALFIPFPFAVDDHQTANAQGLKDAGAAEVIQQKDLTAEKLAAIIQAHQLREYLAKKAIAARSCSHADALEKITNALQGLLR